MAYLTQEHIDLVKAFEGLKLNAYLLENKPHIGYGFTFYSYGYLINKFGRKSVKIGDKITQAEADAQLEILLSGIEDFINRTVKVELTQGQIGALASLIYNIGETAFLNSNLLKKLNSANYSGAADEFEKWVYSDGKINTTLVARRKRERELFENASSGTNYLFLFAIVFFAVTFLKK